MRNLAAFSVTEVKRVAAGKREKEEYSSAERQSGSNHLSENCRKGALCWGRRTEKGRQLEKLVVD